RDALHRTLTAMAGPEAEPRDGQLAAVEALTVDRGRVLVVQATGWGKSAVYWAATAANRAAGFGPTLVVSPLLALMRDQGAAAEPGRVPLAGVGPEPGPRARTGRHPGGDDQLHQRRRVGCGLLRHVGRHAR